MSQNAVCRSCRGVGKVGGEGGGGGWSSEVLVGRAQGSRSDAGSTGRYVHSNRYSGQRPSLGMEVRCSEVLQSWRVGGLRFGRWTRFQSQALSRGSAWSVRGGWAGGLWEGRGPRGAQRRCKDRLNERATTEPERRGEAPAHQRAKSYSMVQCGGGVL